MTRRPLIILALLLALAVLAGGSWLARQSNSSAGDTNVLPNAGNGLVRPHSPILGFKDAPVTIVEFFDPACEACRAFHPTVKRVLAVYGQSVRVVIRYAPFHGDASEAAVRILEAARMQNLFEPVLEALLREQPRWASHSNMNPELLPAIAKSAGLDLEKAESQLNSPEVDQILKQDRADIVSHGIRATPSFFVNGEPLKEFGRSQFQAMVASAVEAAKR